MAPDGGELHRLGTSVAIEGDIIVAGAPYAVGTERQAGAAYLYRLDPNTSQWDFEVKLMGADDRHSGLAGYSVAVSGDTVAVGVPYGYHHNNGQRTGAVRLFSFDNDTGVWKERESATPMIGNARDQFGHSVAIAGGNVWIGAKGVDSDPANPPSPFIDSGQATTFDLNCQPRCEADLDGDGQVTFFDLVAFISAFNNGDPSTDIAAPFGTIDFFDIIAYIDLYSAGCP